MSKKVTFAGAVIGVATSFADLRQRVKELNDAYQDRKHYSGGASEIIDSDIVSLEITAAQLSAFISSFATRLDTFMGGGVPTAFDGDAAINAIRNDF